MIIDFADFQTNDRMIRQELPLSPDFADWKYPEECIAEERSSA